MKDKSTLNAAFVIGLVGGIIGGVIMAATSETNDFTGQTTHNGVYAVGVLIVGVSALFLQYAVIGWSIKSALREHAAEHNA